MNYLIKEMIKVAKQTSKSTDWYEPVYVMTPEQMEKFTQLITEQCAELCDRFGKRDMHPTECAGAMRQMFKDNS